MEKNSNADGKPVIHLDLLSEENAYVSDEKKDISEIPKDSALMTNDASEAAGACIAPQPVPPAAAIINDSINTITEEIPIQHKHNRLTFILLALYLPGIHNLYAGYWLRGIIQLLCIVLTCFLASPLVWIWAIVEAFVVEKDSKNICMKPGSVKHGILLAIGIFFAEIIAVIALSALLAHPVDAPLETTIQAQKDSWSPNSENAPSPLRLSPQSQPSQEEKRRTSSSFTDNYNE